MGSYPNLEVILAFIVENIRKSNNSSISLTKLKKDFSKKYGIQNKKFKSMVDQYLVGETKQESFEGYSDALSQIFNIAINILLGTAVITGQSSFSITDDTSIPIGVEKINYEILKSTGRYNLCLISLMSEIIHESFYHSTDTFNSFSHENTLDDIKYYFDSINSTCYEDYKDNLLIRIRDDLISLFTFAYGNDLIEKVDIKQKLVGKIRELSPQGFEKFCLVFLSKILSYNGGNVSIDHLGKIGDGGFDGVITNHNILDGDATYYIQCKRYKKNNIQRSEIQSFIGAMSDKTISANRGVFLTTSKFAKGAREYSMNSIKQVKLFDIDEIVLLMIENQIGLSALINIQLQIDEDFFEQFWI
ncbi:restriction endonuclease [Acinetobacter baumannii]|nr:restriction endonuclease [Acinetobacter baumannii]EKT9844943.1 restriction endonuclease [Acinetobacter baumannii]